MQTRIVYSKIWEDEFFVSLSVPEKLLFLYYITNSRINIINCYECLDRQAVFDVDTTIDVVREFKKKAEAKGKLFFKGNYVVIKNAERYQNYKGPKNENAKQKAIDRLPEDISLWRKSLLGENDLDRSMDSTIHTPGIVTRNHYQISKFNTKNLNLPDSPPEKPPSEASKELIRQTLGISKKLADHISM